MGMYGDNGKFVPQGVSPLKIRQGPAFQLGQKNPLPAPAAAPVAAPQAPAPSQELSGGEQVHVVEVVGEGPDGRKYIAPFDVVFPKGSRILGMRERRS